ncbi:hypothetical protein KC19_9G057300 [Ceratodon purpureus]|uniref:Uncharacterized protein n=1 Tax=Ceratodon purpureus TaxID=3225 RepID=A0A8T0GT52_CERPU|nr:hypothetical protein KC19_9G057300 [Ceratodon purpureus]
MGKWGPCYLPEKKPDFMSISFHDGSGHGIYQRISEGNFLCQAGLIQAVHESCAGRQFVAPVVICITSTSLAAFGSLFQSLVKTRRSK